MNILKTNIEDSKELYKLTHNPDSCKMATAEGAELSIGGYAIYEDADRKTGAITKICAVKDGKSGKIFATNSVTFVRSLEDIVTMIPDVSVIKVCGGTSKNGRHYLDCVLVD